MKTLTFLVARQDGQTLCETQNYLHSLGVSDALIAEVYGSDWYWLTLTLREPTYALHQAIRRACQRSENGLIVDDVTVLPEKRFVALVQSMSPGDVTEAAFLAFPAALATLIDAALLQYSFPSITSDPNFVRAWSRLQASPEPAEAGEKSCLVPSGQGNLPEEKTKAAV